MARKFCKHCGKQTNFLTGQETKFGTVHFACFDSYSKSLLSNTSEPGEQKLDAARIAADSQAAIPSLLLSTTDEIDGCRTLKNLGVVRGSTVRSRHVGSDFAANLKSIVGGELKGVTKLIADGREQAFARMCREAESLGANAVKGLRFSTSQVWEGAAEVMAYGTAVVVEAIDEQRDGGN